MKKNRKQQKQGVHDGEHKKQQQGYKKQLKGFGSNEDQGPKLTKRLDSKMKP